MVIREIWRKFCGIEEKGDITISERDWSGSVLSVGFKQNRGQWVGFWKVNRVIGERGFTVKTEKYRSQER